MKVVITKDEHNRLGFRDKFRKPKWEEAMLKKHQFISEYMLNHGISIKLTTGDIFDKQKGWSFNQYRDNKKVFDVYKKSNQEIWTIAGNHDYLEGRTSIEDSVFEEYRNQNLIQHLSSTGWCFGDKDPESIVFGIDYISEKIKIQEEINKISTSSVFKNAKENGINTILILHANVTPDEERVTEFTYQELSKYNFDVIVCGHYHNGFSPSNINGTLFINPWNLWRVVRDYSVQTGEHTPEFVVLDLKTLEFEVVQVPHLNYTEAFDLKEIDFYKKIKKETFSFFEKANLEDMDIEEDLDDLQIIKEKLIKSSKIDISSITDEDLEWILSDLEERFKHEE